MNFIRAHILSRFLMVFIAIYILVVGLYSPRKMMDTIIDSVRRKDMMEAEIDRLHK